jgi:hypothetical protein
LQADSGSISPSRRGRRPSSFVFPLLLVIVGAVLLLNNLGWLPWSVWTALGQLWPVILILFGIDLLIGRRNAWLGATVTAVALVVVLGAAVWLTFTGATISAPTAGSAAAAPTDQNLTASPQRLAATPLAGATSGRVNLEFGAGVLNLGPLPDSGTDFVRATASLPPGMRLNQKAITRGEVADVTLSTEGNNGFWPFHGFDQNARNMSMDAQLTTKVPLTVQANIGAGQSDFDLTNLSVREFNLNSGAGQATIHLPASAGQTTADIHSGAGQVIIVVPPGVGAYIHGSNGLVNLRVPTDRFEKVGDGYQTSGFQSAANRVDVTLHVGVGEVDVR